MTPAARLAAVMEITDLLLAEWQREQPRPAEQVVKAYTRERRYMGGGDRRAIQEAVFVLLRKFGALKRQCENTGLLVNGRSLALLADPDAAALCGSSGYAPEPLSEAEQRALPAAPAVQDSLPLWLQAQLQAEYGDETQALIAALLKPAMLDLRVNRLKADREQVQQVLRAEGIETQAIEGVPDALEAPRHAAITRSRAYENGWVEIQDRSSQAITQLLAEMLQSELVRGEKRLGERSDGGRAPLIIDYCAGAGGKSLALAALLGNRCRILAQDVEAKRLAELMPRAERAGASCIEVCEAGSLTAQGAARSDGGAKHRGQGPFQEKADLVLLDVPCSGMGTLRRHPDLPWRLTEQRLAHYQALQRQILAEAAGLVRPGGLLAYVTCSLLEAENSQSVNDFLTTHPNFRVVTGGQIWDNSLRQPGVFVSLLPHRREGDGFFAALLQNQ